MDINVDINDLRAGVTVVMMALFAGIVWWAYSDRRKTAYDEAARIPLDDDLPLSVQEVGEAEKRKFS